MYPMSMVHLFLLWAGLLSSSFLQVGVVAIPMPNTSVSLEPRASRTLDNIQILLNRGRGPTAKQSWSLFVGYDRGYRTNIDLSAVEAVLSSSGARQSLTRVKDEDRIGQISFETKLGKQIVFDSLFQVQCGEKCSTRLFWIIHALEELRQSPHITSFQFLETRWLDAAEKMIESRGTADGRSVVGTPAEEEYKKLETTLNALRGHITVEEFQDIALGKVVVV
ncbi:MAG: hypothetical protein NXY57DRAFT_1011654 [Lentinula lateritia]|uniref:Uncharacterized protein n=1 Tax=Lentinula lateritia TaxID=40482 RepID=A0ABQ8VGM7_9AGAR|nr:MAG: hypothetical protein NXY57DRAFT_1011654 [Lentinula lateritia]KAJ4493400.1 hypothetical protein C8R41DRAFT_830970 [Lentinula lateritia]